jgi:dTDP-4-amino-4,6-dideoxygalactose transaminase
VIPVTKTFLPPIEDYNLWIKKVFDNQWLTNRGELLNLLEDKLKKYLGVNWITITNNGTVPIQIALKLLAKGGEVITTPFSYVATTAAIVWENCTPVFVDIHPDYLTIDETKIEAAITSKTTCILATHVFGNPCNVEAIETIAKKYKLKVIYDAAHCFGVNYRNKSIFDYGDVSTCSFHATKIFHSAEGGAMFSNNDELKHQLFYSHNFGHDGPLAFHGLGVNGKISEIQAAMGLAVLPYMGEILQGRKEIVNLYDSTLDFSKIRRLKIRENTSWNYSYYPVIIESEEKLLKIQKELNEHNIVPRRYFYPSLNTLPYVNSEKMPVSESTASCILCLPLYIGLKTEDVRKITEILNRYA